MTSGYYCEIYSILWRRKKKKKTTKKKKRRQKKKGILWLGYHRSPSKKAFYDWATTGLPVKRRQKNKGDKKNKGILRLGYHRYRSNYGPQICSANKLAGKMELVLLLNEWTSLFIRGTFQRYVFMLSTRLVRPSGNNFNCLTKHGATLSSLNISRRTYCSGYDEHACDTIFFPECWKLKNRSLKSMVITFCKKHLSCDRVIKRSLGIWAHKYAGKHMVSVNNCCLQLFNSRVVF